MPWSFRCFCSTCASPLTSTHASGRTASRGCEGATISSTTSDRLAYLNIIEKFNCTYCSYANGLSAYVKEIVGRTEQYWCPIKHARRILHAHPHYADFVDFGDAEAYRRELDILRRKLVGLDEPPGS